MIYILKTNRKFYYLESFVSLEGFEPVSNLKDLNEGLYCILADSIYIWIKDGIDPESLFPNWVDVKKFNGVI